MTTTTTKRVVFISDTQIPFEFRPGVRALLNYIEHNADGISAVYHVGDLMDYPQPSRWNRLSRGEYEGSVAKDSKLGQQFLAKLRDVYDGPVGVVSSNHDERPLVYQQRFAPALFDVDDETNPFHIQNLLRFADYDVDYLGDHFEFVPGWVLTHLHLGYSLSRYAGGTAINAAKRIGKSVVGGHTHRAGIVSESFGYEGHTKTLTGVEIGNLMSMKEATYLKNGAANWQQAWAYADICGKAVTPVIVPVQANGSFVVERELYKP